MGKRLDQLNLSDDDRLPHLDDLAASRKAAGDFVEELRAMEDDDRYGFCWGMIVDMRFTVERSERVTDNQKQAIQNVKDGVARRLQERNDGRVSRRGSRRYEGWWEGDR